ncbi:MAG: 16S rRNA (cytosine(967)-C(5))-methyltransferase RsmB [Vulcanimicrobiaceae bacterium]
MKRLPRAGVVRRVPALRHESRPIAVDPKLAAREVAFQVVSDVFGEESRGAQAAFDVRARRAELDGRDRAFAAELAYGSIKARRLIDYYLAPYLADRDRPLTVAIGEVLRLGVYQLRFMSGVDDHAAVSETVNLAWKHGHKGTAGLVNAVLRRMIADGTPELFLETFKNRNDYLGTKYSMPSWIAGQYAASYPHVLDAALAGVNAAPQHAIRINALRTDVATVRDELLGRGIAVARSAYVAESLIVDAGTLGDDPGGRYNVQGEAATMPVDLLAPQPGETVLEMCSGRGNKTVQIAARLEGSGGIVCVEIDDRKIRVLRETLERCDVGNVGIVAGDARVAAADVAARAVLLDAPCSGTGVIGRHPEARWRKDVRDGERLAVVQRDLLRAGGARTLPGGRLVYSVCSSDAREGRAVVDAFLAERHDFSRAPIPERYTVFARDGDVVVPAGVAGRDGFYIASLVRSA